MKTKISKRLLDIVEALPLHDSIRVLEIGCGTGVAARELVSRVKNAYVLGIDRSAKAIRQAIDSSGDEMASGNLEFRCMAIEELELPAGGALFDIAFAVRVGALDGRHPHLGALALPRIAKVLKENGRLYIDGGDPIRMIPLDISNNY